MNVQTAVTGPEPAGPAPLPTLWRLPVFLGGQAWPEASAEAGLNDLQGHVILWIHGTRVAFPPEMLTSAEPPAGVPMWALEAAFKCWDEEIKLDAPVPREVMDYAKAWFVPGKMP